MITNDGDWSVYDKGVCQQESSLGSGFCFKLYYRHTGVGTLCSLQSYDNDNTTYLVKNNLLIFPQNEKKSDTVFSLALGDMLETITALLSYEFY